MANGFFWYDLITSDTQSAQQFYGKVIGWTFKPHDPANPDYTVIEAGGQGVGGILRLTEMPPCWIGYIHVSDVEAAVANVQSAGASLHKPITAIPGVGRFAVAADPGGAVFQMLQVEQGVGNPGPGTAPGKVGWHELYAEDGAVAWKFYSEQFGWRATEKMDIGPEAVYQMFSFGDGAETVGGMMTREPHIPRPAWLFYFNVDKLDAAVQRIQENGGQITLPAMEVPGGMWIAQCRDPQNAPFAIVAPAR